MLPILSLSEVSSPGYINRMKELFPLRNAGIVSEADKLIIIDALWYKPPHVESETIICKDFK